MSDDPSAAATPMSPYVIEGARSSRSRCKTCRRKIDAGSLRIGILIEGPYGTGYLWHHLTCAARRQFDRVAEAYEMEAWKQAKQVPDKLPELDKLQSLREKAEARRQERKTIPYAEVAPSGRSACKHCGKAIAKDEVRVVLGRAVYFGSQVRTAPINVHAACVREALGAGDCETEPEGLGEALSNNSRDLTEAQLATLLERIGPLTSDS